MVHGREFAIQWLVPAFRSQDTSMSTIPVNVCVFYIPYFVQAMSVIRDQSEKWLCICIILYIEMRVQVSVPVVLVQSFDFKGKELPVDSFFPAFTRPCTREMLFYYRVHCNTATVNTDKIHAESGTITNVTMYHFAVFNKIPRYCDAGNKWERKRSRNERED